MFLLKNLSKTVDVAGNSCGILGVKVSWGSPNKRVSKSPLNQWVKSIGQKGQKEMQFNPVPDLCPKPTCKVRRKRKGKNTENKVRYIYFLEKRTEV